jgi:hypothetical protein
MTIRVCLSAAKTLSYPQGGHLWVFLNWALGFRSIGCDVTWLDVVPQSMSIPELQQRLAYLRSLLSPFGITSIAVDYISDEGCTSVLHTAQLPTIEQYGPFELLFDIRYNLPRRLLKHARRSALLDIDPGHLHLALKGSGYPQPRHDLFFTIGERVGREPFSAGTGRNWIYTPPCVFLPEWPVWAAPSDAPWTTVAHWWADDAWMPDPETGAQFCDDKREGFEAFMALPAKVPARFELALCIGDHRPSEKARIESHGFKVLDPYSVASTPTQYRAFIQSSAGEFSAVKPSCVKYQTAWISDRTICYLASGKPCVVEDTGPSDVLPSGKGLHRVREVDAAAAALAKIYERYDDESRAAREIARAIFDATEICRRVLARVL